MGDGGFYVTSALFFSRVVGLIPTQIGAGLTIAWTAGFLLATPMGQGADRVGLRRAAIGLSLLTALALVVAVMPRSMGGFVAVTLVYAVAQSGSTAVRQALLVTLAPPQTRVLIRARLQAAVNIGLAVGAGLGGLALLIDTTPAYVAVLLLDASAFATAGAMLTRLPHPPAHTPMSPSCRPARRLAVLSDRPYVIAAVLTAVLYLYMPMLSVVLPLYVARATSAPTWTVAAIFVLNTAGVALLQVRAARAVTSLATAVVAIRRAGGALLLCCLAFALAAHSTSTSATVLILAAAVALQILGEVLLASGSWEIGFTLADPRQPGQWQGLFSSGIPLARALGPLALTSLVLTWSGPGWLVLGAVFLTAALLMGPVVAWAARNPHQPAPTAGPRTNTGKTSTSSARPSRTFRCPPRKDDHDDRPQPGWPSGSTLTALPPDSPAPWDASMLSPASASTPGYATWSASTPRPSTGVRTASTCTPRTPSPAGRPSSASPAWASGARPTGTPPANEPRSP